MSILKRTFLVTIFIICISFSFCFAIDENQLSSGSAQPAVTNSIDDVMSINTGNTNLETTNTNEVSSTSTVSSTPSVSTSADTQRSTTVSSVTAGSNSSTISDILNIALIVVGVLLIFLAIAILIRLNS